MPRVAAPLYSLNGGEVGDEALARLDLQRLQFAGSLYSNMLPRVIGSMTLRPGLEDIADLNLGEVMLLEYAYSGTSTLIPVLSNNAMRILKDGALVSRVAVSTTITNGDFSSFAGWTNSSSAGASASVSGGNLVLAATPQARASATQTVAIAGADLNKEHGLRLTVTRGPVSVYLGSSAGARDLLEATNLDDGTHSIAFTPTTTSVFLDIWSGQSRQILVDACMIDAPGVLVLPTPWTSADLASNIIRYRQSLDVIYVASGIYQQREIQRRGDTSWGIQRYKVDDGPFTISDGNVSLAPDGYIGNITLTANKNYFDARMTGRLIRLVQSGQAANDTITTAPFNGAHVRVSGVGLARRVQFSISGTWTGTIWLQEAIDDGSGNPSSWIDIGQYTANISTTYDVPDDNVIKYVRLATKPGGFTSGTANTSVTYPGGTRSGVVRITGVSTPTSATAEVLSRLYSVNATFDWDFSLWSDYDGWPNAVESFGGRLFWVVGGQAFGSVPDAYKSFDDTVEGASAPIVRSINPSSQRGALWLLGLQRLIAGTDVSEISIKASGFDEPLSATAWFPVDASTRGCANIRSVKADKDGIFVQASGTALFRLALDQTGYDYIPTDLTAMHEEICGGSQIVDIAVQRRPDTVIWIILANGEARALTYEPGENVIAWSRVVSNGQFKRVATSRGSQQDAVYFAIIRNGLQRLERLAKLEDCRGGATNCLADGFTRFTATAGQTTFSVPNLAGMQVTVWANGVSLHDQNNLYTATGGNVVLPAQAAGAKVVIGLPYTGKWQSTKLAFGAAGGTALMRRKRISQLGIYMWKTMLDGLRVGYDFSELRKLTTTKDDKPIAAGTLFNTFDVDLMSISSDWDTDSRVCVEAKTPYPFTASAMVMDLTTNG